MARKLTITIAKPLPGEYVTLGDTYQATQAKAGHDWRITSSQGGTFMRDRFFQRAVKNGAIVTEG